MGEVTGDDLNRRCAHSLIDLDDRIEADGDGVRVGNHELRVKAVVENTTVVEKGVFVGVVVEVAVDGVVQPLTTGMVGSASTQKGAVAAALDQWREFAGAPTVAALLPDAPWGGDIEFDGVIVRAGCTAMRSDVDIPWTQAHGQKLLAGLRTAIVQMPSVGSTLHSIWIYYETEVRAGEVRIDTIPVEEIAERLPHFAWPTPEVPYMIKQFFVVRGPDWGRE